MKAINRYVVAMALASMAIIGVKAEETSVHKVDASMSIELVNRYIWRGQDLGDVSIQPGADISYRGFSLGVWGSTGFNEDYVNELDFTLGYSYKGFSASVTDYWFSNGPGYFKYKAHDTSHVFEAHVGYDFGILGVDWYTNFAGNDGVNGKVHRAYSSYVELNAPFTLGGLDWNASVGSTPYSTSFYNAHGFAVINIGVGVGKDFSVNDMFGIDVHVKTIFNPRDDKGFLTAGVTFHTK